MAKGLVGSTDLTHVVACNPLKEVYHTIELTSGSQLNTGQPIMVYGGEEVIGLIYREYDENDIDSNEPYETEWSVGYDKAGAEEACMYLSSYDYLDVSPIKHPARDEWAVPSHDVVFASLPSGPVKDALADLAAQSIAEGRRKNQAEMLADGWE